MKLSHFPLHSRSFLALPLLALISILHPVTARSAEHGPDTGQQLFGSPKQASKALLTATQANDQAALLKLFGPKFPELLTGDAVLDGNNAKTFAKVMAEGCELVKTGPDQINLEIGASHWPVPIPLVRKNGLWSFDTAAGREEIINRHIGNGELHAIGVCHVYVKAQEKFLKARIHAGLEPEYAQHFKSTDGTHDGLYWRAAGKEQTSPLGALVAGALADGYVKRNGPEPRAFHGYCFRILTRQGWAATGGKKNYLRDGKLVGGFGLVAYPEHWNQSGIMTFIVNQDGKVFEKNLGEDTFSTAIGMDEYNPTSSWRFVGQEGIMSAGTEN